MKYRFKTRPFVHQVRGVKFALRQFQKGLGVAFLFEPRTGKTKTTVDTLGVLHHKYGVRRVLVIAPNRVLGTWVHEIHTHCPLTVQTIVWDRKARKTTLPKSVGPYDLQVVIVNFEAFGTPGRRTPSGRRSRSSGRFKHRKLIYDWVGNDQHAACVIDEGHKLKSPSGKASNLIVSMRDRFAYRFLLTGTPITKAKRAADIFMEWQWVNPERFASWGATYQEFREHTGVWTYQNNIPIWRRAKPEGMRDLQRGLHADGMVVHRADCFDLPPKLPDRIVHVELSPVTKQAYDDMANDLVVMLENGEISEASIPLVVTLRLSQITSGFIGIQKPHPTREDKFISVARRISTEKLKALKELLVEETIEREEKVVICARFKSDLDAIQKLCTHLKIPWWSIRGGDTRSATDEALRAFRVHDDGPAAMIVQPSAGGVGIDMSTASHLVWYSLVPSWVDFTQMNDRIALSPTGVQYTFLIATGTVDQLIYETLQLDGDVSREILKRPERILRHDGTR